MRLLVCLLAAVFLALGWSGDAQAQSVGPKKVCEGISTSASGCDTLSGSPTIGDPVYYEFELYGGPVAETLDITENYSPAFVPANSGAPVRCIVTNGPNIGASLTVTTVSAGPPYQFTVDLAAGQDAICRMDGTFVTAGANAQNRAGITAQGAPNATNTFISTDVEFDADLEISKTRLTPVTAPMNIAGTPGRARYRIEITTDEAIYLGEFFRVYDQLALFPNATAIDATLQPGSTCQLEQTGGGTSTVAGCALINDFSGELNAPGWKAFASWGFTPGSLLLLKPGETLVIEYEVEYAVPTWLECVLAADSEGIRNRAFLGLAGSATALRDDSNGNNDTVGDTSSDLALETGIYNVDQNCNAGGGAIPATPPSPVTIKKILLKDDGTAFKWGDPVAFVIQIKNTSTTATAYDLEVEDVLGNLQGTPNFTAQLINSFFICGSVTCTQTSPGSATPPAGPKVLFTSYYDRKQMWTAVIPQLGPGQLVNLQVAFKFEKPSCDFAPLIQDKMIRNTATVSHKIDYPGTDENGNPITQTVGYSQSAIKDFRMDNPPVCAISVKKTAKPILRSDGMPLPADQIIFNEWKSYELVFSSLPPTPTHNTTLLIGTLIDAVRIENAFYATGLSVDYQWQCTDLSGGGVRNFQQNGSGTASVNHVGAPHQGVRVMSHPGVVEFDPGASLKCDVRLKVKQPPKEDPYCYSDGQPYLQDLALMDGSRFFNATMPWPHAPQGMSWDATSDKLPRCYNLVVNKFATPAVVSPSGGPINYTVTIQNANRPGTKGDFEFNPGYAPKNHGPHFIDRFQGNPALNSLPGPAPVPSGSNPCQPANAHPCDVIPEWGSKQQHFIVSKLAAGQGVSYSYDINGPFDPHQLCNVVEFEAMRTELVGILPDRDWYPKDPSTWSAKACVLVRGSLEVEKSFVVPSWVSLAANTPFTIEVDCNAPSGFSDFKSDLVVSPGNPRGRIDRIVIGTSCDIDEVKLPDPKQWGDCQWQAPAYPLGRAITIDGSADPHRLEVVNTLTCTPPTGQLTILKELLSPQDCPTINAFCQFRITIINNGTTTYNGPLQFKDVFSNGLTGPGTPGYYWIPNSTLPPGWSCNQPNGGNNPLTCGVGNVVLNPGDSISVDINFDMPASGANCAILEAPLLTPTPESCVDVGGDPARFTIEKELVSDPFCVFTLNPCRFRITVTKIGGAPYNGPLTVDDVTRYLVYPNLAPNIANAGGNGWNCTNGAISLNCTHPGPAFVGSSSTWFEIDVESSPAIGGIRNCVTLQQPGQVPPPEACLDVTGQQQPYDPANLTIEKRKITSGRCDGTGAFAQNCDFEFVITNSGSTDYTGKIVITDTVDVGGSANAPVGTVTVVSVGPGWSCTTNQNVVECEQNPVTIPAGGSITVPITLDIEYPFPPTGNCATIGSVDLNGVLQTSCVTFGDEPVNELTISKTLVSDPSCAATLVCTFRITVTNNQPGTFAGPVQVSDVFTGNYVPGFHVLTATDPHQWDWLCQQQGAGTQVTCDETMLVLATGDSSYVDITLAQITATGTNCAAVQVPATNPVMESCVDVGSSGSSSLTITKTLVSDPGCIANALCTFRITVTNTGSGGFSGPVQITDTFTNAGGQAFYYLGSVNPYQWDWQCQQAAASAPLNCNESDLQLAPNGGSAWFDVTLDLGPEGTNCAILDQPALAPKPESCVAVGNALPTNLFTIRKSLRSQVDCAQTTKICTFRISLVLNPGSSWTGPITIGDVVDLGGTPTPTPILAAGGGGWLCTPRPGNFGLDCTHPGPVFSGSTTVGFDVTLDLTQVPPVHIGNCATITDPAQNPPTRSCVQLGPMWEPPVQIGGGSLIGITLTKKQRKDLTKQQEKFEEQQAEASGEKRKKKLKLPKVKVQIGIGGILGGGRKKGDDRRPEPQPKPDGVD